MRDISSRTIAVDHPEGCGSDICELVKDARGNVDSLSSVNRGALVAETHFTASFQDEIDLFLGLIVPGHLPTIWIESDVSEREACSLDGTRATHEILGQPARGIASPGDLCQVCDSHSFTPSIEMGNRYRIRR